MREYIKNILVNVYATATTDKYGQINKHNFSLNLLFKEKVNDVLEYIKTNPIIEISTYGGYNMIYKAVSDILDTEIKEECKKAFLSNPNRIRNLNSW